jgi:hypothetical protein
MTCGVLSWLVAAALGQAGSVEAALKAIPADSEIVFHVRSLSGVRDDAMAMIRAMSPTLAEQVGPLLEQNLDPMLKQFGPKVTDAPYVLGMKLPAEGGGEPSVLIAFPGDYEALLAAFAGGKAPEVRKLEGGLESFIGPQGETIYAARRDGVTLLGPVEEDVRAAAIADAKSIDGRLNDALRAALTGGDIGVFVDAARLQERFADQITAAREQLMAVMDQAAGQVAAGQAEQAKQVYAAMFDALKDADALALNVDLDAAAFDLSGIVTVKTDSQAAGSLDAAKPGAGEVLGRLPAGGLVYAYTSTDAESMSGLMRWNMNNLMGPGAQADAAAKAMIDGLRAAGHTESAMVMSFDGGMRMTQVSTAEHPERLAESTKSGLDMARKSPTFKEVTFEENVGTHRGFTLSRVTMSFDFEKLAGGQVAGNPGAEAMIKTMLGGGTFTTFGGTDGTRVVSIAAKTLDEAKAQLDAVLDGTNSVGGSAGFRAARARLPREVTGLMLVRAQGLVRMMADTLGAVMGGQPLPVPADLPKEPAFFGGSLTMTAAGYRFDLVIPSEVGPVLEKGLVPLFMGLQGKINQ